MNKKIKIFAILSVLIVGLYCGDSLKNRLTRRLNSFREALPADIREKFDAGEYDDAGRMLDERIQRIKGYIEQLPDDVTKKKFIRGDYEGIEKYLSNIPKDDLEFNKRFYEILDYECIPTFTGYQIVDYFKVYFKEKLAELNKK